MNELDISSTTEPRSDQQNYDDYIAGPKTVQVSGVSRGDSEQPVNIELAEFPGRPYKPNKSMRRVLVAAWGKDASQYVGRYMTLYGDPNVKWGGKTVGGIKISHLSHIEKPFDVNLTVTRGKREKHTVQPLQAPQQPPQAQQQAPDIPALIEQAAGDPVKVQKLYDWAKAGGAPDHVLEQITASQQPLEGDQQ